MRLRFRGFPHTDVYRCHGQEPWQIGDVREVPDKEARRMLRDHPMAFADEGRVSVSPSQRTPEGEPVRMTREQSREARSAKLSATLLGALESAGVTVDQARYMTADQLLELPGIGPARAGAIVKALGG